VTAYPDPTGELPVSLSGPIANPTTRQKSFLTLMNSKANRLWGTRAKVVASTTPGRSQARNLVARVGASLSIATCYQAAIERANKNGHAVLSDLLLGRIGLREVLHCIAGIALPPDDATVFFPLLLLLDAIARGKNIGAVCYFPLLRRGVFWPWVLRSLNQKSCDLVVDKRMRFLMNMICVKTRQRSRRIVPSARRGTSNGNLLGGRCECADGSVQSLGVVP
jgi:hypothetical protein